jgi:hypothetical protein
MEPMSYNPAYSNKNHSPQHYQSFNRWLRWHYGSCADGKLQLVSRDSGETVATIVGVWAILLEEASDLNHWGIANDDHQYHAVILGLDLDTVVKVVKGFISLRMVEPRREGGIRILNWHKRQYYTDAKDPTHIERKARWLKNKAGTEWNAQERFGTPETDTDTDTDKKESKEDTANAVLSANKPYAFESGVIRLSEVDLAKWKRAFGHLDLEAELLSLTEWAAAQPKWFFAVSGALAKRNRELKAKKENGTYGTDRERRKADSERALARLKAFGEGRTDGDVCESPVRVLPHAGVVR